MADKDDVAVNYEEDEQDVMDEVETEIEMLDSEYVEDETDESDDVSTQVKSPDEAKTQEKIESLRERLEGGESSTAEAMKEVAATLKEMREQPKNEQSEETVEDLQELRKKLADGFYDDPMTAVDTWIDKRLNKYEREKLQPAFNQMASVLKDTTLDGSKRAATEDETGKFVMEHYADEVEQLVTSGQVQIGPGAYKKAVNQVGSAHLDELLDWKIEQRDKKQADESDEEVTRKPGRNANPRSGSAPPKPNSKLQVSTAARDAIYKMADAKMINRQQFFDSYVRMHPDEVRKLNKRR